MVNIPELFGSLVFNEKVMQERLPEDIYIKIKKTISDGKRLDADAADVIATAMKDWAIEKGATHFTHWFQPMTGITAEKHECFISTTKDERVIMDFSGKELIKGESDASSFFTTVHSVLYGRSDEDFQRVIDQESTPKEENTTQKTTPKTEISTPKTNPKEEESTPKKLGATAQSILDVLSEDPYLKREEIAERVGLKLEGLKYQLGQLQKKGYLLRIEGRKNGRWKVLIKK